jgi:hypothetical protein
MYQPVSKSWVDVAADLNVVVSNALRESVRLYGLNHELVSLLVSQRVAEFLVKEED